ncbi:MAG: hypothetical protein LBQ83_04510 [Candidatus Margulisbacteria bacterium]|jgi:hypothetical protein|nr:hypothetical protein [Candidatus Margulisiibacteriota bacterium]
MSWRKIFCLCAAVLFLSGCWQHNVDEAVLRQNIGELLDRYQRGVNELNRGLLESVISDKFSFYEKDRAARIDGLLTMTALIDRMTYSNIRVENYKIFADVQTEGSIILRPEVQIPLFKPLPFMSGQLKSRAVFAFLYEEDGGLKIFAEDQVLTEKEAVWGDQPPVIINPVLSRYRAAPGDQLEVSFQLDKAGNDVAFVFVNEQMLGGYALDEYGGSDVTYALKVPAELKRGDSFEVRLMIFGGRLDLNNPQQADLQGAAVRSYILQVR